MSVHAIYIPSDLQRPEEAIRSPEPELWTVVSYCVRVESRAQSALLP